VDRTSSSEGSRCLFDRTKPLLEPVARTPFVARAQLREAETSRAILPAPDGHRSRANARRAVTRPPVPAPPREGRCVQSKTEVRSTAVRLDGLEDRSSRSSEWVSRPRSTCAPKNTDALQITRTCAFFTAFRCRHDAPSSGRGSSERPKRLVANPLP